MRRGRVLLLDLPLGAATGQHQRVNDEIRVVMHDFDQRCADTDGDVVTVGADDSHGIEADRRQRHHAGRSASSAESHTIHG